MSHSSDDDDDDDDSSTDSSDTESVCSTTSSLDGEQSATVYVGGFPEYTTEKHIRSHFSQFSTYITNVSMIRDHDTKKLKGFAFLKFSSEDVAEQAIKHLNQSKLLGSTLRVSPKRYRGSRVSVSMTSRPKQGSKQKRERSVKRVKVLATGFPNSVPQSSLQSHFASCSFKPIDIKYPKPKSGRPFVAFLWFPDAEAASKAIREINNTKLLGRYTLTLAVKTKKRERGRSRPKKSDGAKPPLSPQPKSSVIVTNVPTGIDTEDWKTIFGKCGHVCSCSFTSLSKLEVAIAFSNLDGAQNAIKEFHNKQFMNCRLNVAIPGTSSSSQSTLPDPQVPVYSPSPAKIPSAVPFSSEPVLSPPILTSCRPPQQHPLPPHTAVPLAPVPSFPPSNSQPVPPLQSPPPPCTSTSQLTLSKQVSFDLHQFFQQHAHKDINTFMGRGGSIHYQNGMMIIQAASIAEVSEFKQRVVDCYCERQLFCSPDQWNWLVMAGPGGSRKVDELRVPFTSNPGIRILEKTTPNLHVLFVGLMEAISAAYEHFTTALNKELTVER